MRRASRRRPMRVAMVSLHTSPLAQPGVGDAGGMNVYLDAAARALVELGAQVEVFTRADDAGPGVVEVTHGYRVHRLAVGPERGVAKEDLPGYRSAFASQLIRRAGSGGFDVVHSHYWLSGDPARLAAQRWGVPWVHSMHTMARAKNAARAAADRREPAARIRGEDRIVAAADILIANTEAEADDLRLRYGADSAAVRVVHPGIDAAALAPSQAAAPRHALGIPADAVVLLFVGRLQPLKAPDLVIRAVADVIARRPSLAGSLQVIVCGGPSGAAALHPSALAELADSLGIGGIVRFEPPVGRAALANLYRAADVTVVPSYNESFGLVALESQAAGTPVVAAAVGGLRTAVADGVGGVLVDGHDTGDWARVLEELVTSPDLRARLGDGGQRYAAGFSWSATAQGLLDSYLAAGARAAEAAAVAAG